MTRETAESLLAFYEEQHVISNKTLIALEVGALLEAARITSIPELNEALPASLANLFDTTKKSVNSVLSALGLHAHKSNRSLLKILADVGKPVAKVFWLGLKAHAAGDPSEETQERLQDALKQIKKSDWVDLIMKLDTLTFHMMTAPLHMIDAITGWHVAADVGAHHETKEKSVDSIEHAVSDLESVAKNLAEKPSKIIQGYVGALTDLLLNPKGLELDAIPA